MLDDVLPWWDVRERHAVRVSCPPERALAAARAVTLAEMPLVRRLFRLRGLPSAGATSMWEQLLDLGFTVVSENPGRQVVAVGVGRPWKIREPLRHVESFPGFAEPGYAKMALSLSSAGGVLATETRVLLTDAAARRRFRIYWLVVRAGSGLIRRLWLRAAERRAGAA